MIQFNVTSAALAAPQHGEDQHEAPAAPGAAGDETLLTEVAHEEDLHPTSILHDTNTYVTLAFLIVIAIAVAVGVPKIIGGFFRSRAENVRTQLDEARSLREEAQKMLADFQKRQREAEEEAEGIIEQAKKDAKIMSEDARQKMDEQIARRRKAAEERIARAEAQAIAEVRGKAADLAVAAASTIIADRVDAKAQGALIDKAIADVGTRLN